MIDRLTFIRHTVVGTVGALLLLVNHRCAAIDRLDRLDIPGEGVPTESAWVEIPADTRADTIEYLIAQTKTNYERIHTWEGVYSSVQDVYLSQEIVKSKFADRLPEANLVPLVEEIHATNRFAVDIGDDKLFCERVVSHFRLKAADSNKAIVVPGVNFTNINSIVAPDEYLFFDPDLRATFSELTTFPEAKNVRAARRVDANKAANRSYGDILDPRLFFAGMNLQAPNWVTLDWYLLTMQGKNGRDKQRIADKTKVEKAELADGIWYRVHIPLIFESTYTTIWSPLAGYNPVQLVLTEDKSGQVTRTISWEWRDLDGIYIPSGVREAVFSVADGVVQMRRVSKLDKCTLNQPLAPGQFDYRGLGLQDGDLVMDEIRREVFKISNRQPVKLAKFGETYVPPREGTGSMRWLWISSNVAIVTVLILAVLHRYWRNHAAG